MIRLINKPKYASGFMEEDCGHELEDAISKHPNVDFEVDEWTLKILGEPVHVHAAAVYLTKMAHKGMFGMCHSMTDFRPVLHKAGIIFRFE